MHVPKLSQDLRTCFMAVTDLTARSFNMKDYSKYNQVH